MKVGNISAEELRQFIERIERLEEEKVNISQNIKDIFTQAKSSGFDTKAMKAVLKQRKMEQAEIDEQENLVDLYKRALGMLPDFNDEE